MNRRRHYDVAIIGAGLSGLAAGIRAAHFGRSVCIFERHNAPGGLNGFYSLNGRKFDVGLHAVTNFVPPTTKGSPLGKLLRQLRIEREELQLREQRISRVAFGGPGGADLRFSNDFPLLESEVARVFPSEREGFRRLVDRIRAAGFDPDAEAVSARAVLNEYLAEPLLREMLLCPLMFYGSAAEDDFPFAQAAMLFQAIFLEGLARPAEGIRLILRVLLDKYRAAGGERRMKCGVRRIRVAGGRAVALELDDGSQVTADRILSSAGAVETLALVDDSGGAEGGEAEGGRGDRRPEGGASLEAAGARPATPRRSGEVGQVTFVETMSVLDRPPASFGWDDTIVFFNQEANFRYRQPVEPVDTASGVICLPNNFQFLPEEQPAEGLLRVTCLARYDAWAGADAEAYAALKAEWFPRVQASARRFLPPVADALLASATVGTDMFTPRTIERFTGHRNGAIYGTPAKRLRGETGFVNLHLCGTDQGFLGIVGSMLSGITMANQHLL